MKKLLLVGFLSAFINVAIGQDAKSITKIAVATHDGNSTEGYYFRNELDEGPMLFAKIRPEVMKRFDLKDESNIGESFRVTYNIKKVGNIEELTIINLEKLDYDVDDDGDEGH
ncbi:MAG: hypothetical protein MUO53_13975 [Maribacter sp.]|nr:hypothetical protein [Maribacter sp.]